MQREEALRGWRGGDMDGLCVCEGVAAICQITATKGGMKNERLETEGGRGWNRKFLCGCCWLTRCKVYFMLWQAPGTGRHF